MSKNNRKRKRVSGWNKPEFWHRRRLLDNLIKWHKQKGCCHWCGIPMTISDPKSQPKGRDFTIEHLLPVSMGGDNSIENTPLSCSSCNNKRGNSPVYEFEESDWLKKKKRQLFFDMDTFDVLNNHKVYELMYEKYSHNCEHISSSRFSIGKLEKVKI